MRIVVLGFGKMGSLIAKFAPSFQFEIAAIVDRSFDKKENRPTGVPCFVALELVPRNSYDLVIDFSSSDRIIERIQFLSIHKKPMVIGITGWNEKMPWARELCLDNDGAVIQSPNFSLGVQLFCLLFQEAFSLFTNFPQYDAALIEMHHAEKKDAPSGTALHMQELAKECRKYLPISSVRCGKLPGTHEVLFDSEIDTITLTHTAKTRDGFAKGALLAAQWISDKKGWFSMSDMILEIKTKIYQ